MVAFTYAQFEQVFLTCKSSKFTKVSACALTDALISTFEIADNERLVVLNAAKRFLRKRDTFLNKKLTPTDAESSDVYLELDAIDPDDELDATSCQYRHSLLEVKARTRYKRTQPIISFLKTEAAKNKVHVNELLGVVVKQLNYNSEKRSSITPIADALIATEKTSDGATVMSMPQVCFLQQNLQLGRINYRTLKKVLQCSFSGKSNYNSIKIPSWAASRSFQKELTPEILFDTHLTGVRFSYIDALKVTLTQILENVSNTITSKNLNVLIKDGVDGSGGHSIYHQMNNEDTRNIIMYMFCVLNIKDAETGDVIFEELMAASPFAMRPLFLVLGKEILGNLGDIKAAVEERQETPCFPVVTSTGTYNVNITAEFSMIDAKMRGLVTGLGGAYCLLCTVPGDTACGRVPAGSLPIQIEEMFNINRTMKETSGDYERLLKPDGTINTLTPYGDRKGVTQKPLIEDDSAFSVSPLHCLMRCFDFVKTLLYHLRSETFMWTKSQIKLGGAHRFLLQAEEEIKSNVKRLTALPLDEADPTGQGGNSNKGDLCKRLLVDHRELMVSFAPERFQNDYRTLISRLWVIIKVYNSKNKIDVEGFKSFCIQTYDHILNSFNNADTRWINISPTLHALLVHSWELIANHDGRGLGEFSESGLENNNNYLRFYRQNLARKVNQGTNMEDCLTRLWLRSDPLIRRSGPPKPKCSRCFQEHFTISCPQKELQDISTAATLDDYCISLLVLD